MERSPDRDGYLEFRNAVNNGNEELLDRAREDWERGDGLARTGPGCYYELLCQERRLEDHKHGDARALDAHMQEHVKEVGNPQLQQELSKNVRQRILEWDSQRRELLFRREIRNTVELAGETKERQAENPNEPENESWFWAKLAVDNRDEVQLIKCEQQLHRDIDRMFDAAHEMDQQHAKALEDRRREIGMRLRSRANKDRKRDADRER
jgi:hypothetical protein